MNIAGESLSAFISQHEKDWKKYFSKVPPTPFEKVLYAEISLLLSMLHHCDEEISSFKNAVWANPGMVHIPFRCGHAEVRRVSEFQMMGPSKSEYLKLEKCSSCTDPDGLFHA